MEVLEILLILLRIEKSGLYCKVTESVELGVENERLKGNLMNKRRFLRDK